MISAAVKLRVGRRGLPTPLVHVRTSTSTMGATARLGRRGCVLTLYGAVLTVAGQLVLHGVIDRSADDPLALARHAYRWDPWFLAWGVAFVMCLWSSHQQAPGTDREP